MKELLPWNKYLLATDANSYFDMTADGKRFLMVTGLRKVRKVPKPLSLSWLQIASKS
jgi:hypothetical protein